MECFKDKYKEAYINKYVEYAELHDLNNESFLFEMSVEILVGYFLKVHSRNPYTEVCRYVKENKLSYQMGSGVKLILSLFD